MVEEGQKIRAKPSPPLPLFGQCPKENVFFSELFPIEAISKTYKSIN